MNSAFEELAAQRFVSLTTFRNSGAPVPTPVWIGWDGKDLVVTTPKASGKVKRLRNNPDVEMRPCGRTGRVEAGAPVTSGRVTFLTDPNSRERAIRILRRKYRLEYYLVMGIELLTRPRHRDRLILRISPTGTP
ncbi:PPOX class probable F420-dependent enzyme [Nakamurella sp. UYEF19]|uniref:PPOX class F420-dependent oxidoreductase n=1 Tax=Nakamurella sp. UYEF19 TaxID=1756392 RepID=UPI0033926C6E